LYLKFLVTELKPFIDKNFSTKPDQKNTFIAGSSMGGLISIYAICEYPKVFGDAA
jgi:predicted alpha/beta superfamily hydrolase